MRRAVVVLLSSILVYAFVTFASARLHWIAFDRSLAEGDVAFALPGGDAASFAGFEPGRPFVEERATRRVLTGAHRPSVAGALHVHTEHSHDSEGTLAELAAAARAADLDFVLISDHFSRAPGPDVPQPPRVFDGVLLVDGREINFGRDVGRVLAFGLDTTITRWDEGVEAFADLLERRGGTAIVAHARSPLAKEAWHHPGTPGIVGWEAFDLSDIARLRLTTPSAPFHMLSILATLPFGRADRSLLRLHRNGFRYPGATGFDSLSMRQPLTAVAGANVHPKIRVGGKLVPDYAPFLRAFANHLVLDGSLPVDPQAASDSIASALAEGRVFLSFGDTERARAFEVGIESGGRPMAGMGDMVSWESGLSLRAALPHDSEHRLTWRVVRNGRTLAWVRDRELLRAITSPGVYRVEVYRYSLAVGPLTWNLQPWIFSNPIHVGAPKRPTSSVGAAP